MIRRSWVIVGLFLVVVGVPSGADAIPPQGPVTIVTNIDFSEFPFSGPFEVTQGAGLLGCSGGTFVDLPAGFDPPSGGHIAKVFTCTDDGEGEFVANFQPGPKPGPGDLNGHWNVTSGTDDFATLHGEGDFSVVFTGPESGEETLTGEVHFD